MIRVLITSVLCLAIFSVAVVLFVFAMGLQKDALVTEYAPPNSAEVIEARAFVRNLRAVINSTEPSAEEFVTNAQEMNSVVKLGARIFPGFRGTVRPVQEGIYVETSLPFELAGFRRWINLSGTVPAFDGAVGVTGLKYGPLPMPGNALLDIGRRGANVFFGEGFGDTVLSAARSMRIADEKLIFVMQMNGVGGNGILRGLLGSMRGSDMPASDDIVRYYVMIREAMDRGDLPTEGSYLPFIQFTLQAALDGGGNEGLPKAFTSAFFGLSLACGARGIGLAVAGLKDQAKIFNKKTWKTDCRKVTFNESVDARLHFTTAAALQSASNRGFAISIGEFKELYDSVESGGFDFTDIAANNSGIRLANTMMAASAEDWPELIARIQIENDVIIDYDGVPSIMSEAQFKARYGDVESPAYKAQLAIIEAKIDNLTLHQ